MAAVCADARSRAPTSAGREAGAGPLSQAPPPRPPLRAGRKTKRASEALKLHSYVRGILLFSPLTPPGHVGRAHREPCPFLEGLEMGVQPKKSDSGILPLTPRRPGHLSEGAGRCTPVQRGHWGRGCMHWSDGPRRSGSWPSALLQGFSHREGPSLGTSTAAFPASKPKQGAPRRRLPCVGYELCPGHCTRSSSCDILFRPYSNATKRVIILPFSRAETEAQRGEVTSLSTHSNRMKTLESDSGLPLFHAFPQHPSATPRASSPIQEGPHGLP